MTKCQQELSKELIKYQKLCQETVKSVFPPETKRQLESMAATAAAIQERIKQNLPPLPKMDLTAIQETLQKFREVAPTKQQIQAAYESMEKLSKLLDTSNSTAYFIKE